METIPQYPSDRWVRNTFLRALAALAFVAIATITLAVLYGCGQARREAPANLVPNDQPSPATLEVVRYFTAMTEDGQIAYTAVTFTDGRYRYTCTVPGPGASTQEPVCKLF